MRKREGIEPRNQPNAWDADLVCNREGHTKRAKSQGSGGSTGV
jgi:hypothetical protein